MKTVRRLIFRAVAWHALLVALAFGSLAFFIDFVEESQDSGKNGYTLVDAMARYRFNEHLSTTLNVKNLFDKTYYTGLGNFGTGFYGEPRTVQLTTRWAF